MMTDDDDGEEDFYRRQKLIIFRNPIGALETRSVQCKNMEYDTMHWKGILTFGAMNWNQDEETGKNTQGFEMFPATKLPSFVGHFRD
uniref:Uncharacterized protein n=1 Tax=Rhizophora mucronata TaxID=61149 RepID=A0A2P2KR46_RHIMU